MKICRGVLGACFVLIGCVHRDTPRAVSSSPGSYLVGQFLRSQGHYEKAFRVFRSALQQSPHSAFLRQKLLVSALEAGHMEQAAMVAQTGASPLAHFIRALLAFKNARYDEALALLPQKTDYPEFASVVLWASMALERWQDALEALTFFQRKPQYREISVFLESLIAWRRGRKEKAQSLLMNSERSALSVRLLARMNLKESKNILKEYAHQENPSIQRDLSVLHSQGSLPPLFPHFQRALAYTLRALSRQGETQLVYARLSLWLAPQDSQALLFLGDVLRALGAFALSSNVYQRILPSSPYAFKANFQRARNFVSQGNTEAALRLLRPLVTGYPHKIEAWLLMGDVYRLQGREVESLATYTQALTHVAPHLSQEHALLLFHRGSLLYKRGRWAKARKDFLKALDIDPNLTELLMKLGHIWIKKNEHVPEALVLLKKVATKSPKKAQVLYDLGVGFYKRGRFVQAVHWFEKAAGLSPLSPQVNAHLGDTYWKLARQREAIFHWKRALAFAHREALKASLKRKLLQGLPSS